jgi:DNA topoisomerase-3
MANRLFIAEKPKLGRDIAQHLGHGRPASGYITVGDDIVTWCFGHLLEMLSPQGYGEQYGKPWKKDVLPIIPSEFKKVSKRDWKDKSGKKADKGIADQINIIKGLVKNCKVVVHAGDADREGQLIVDELLEHIGYRGPALRFWQSSNDDKTFAKELNSLEDNNMPKYRNMHNAALARERIDWLAGMNLSRAMTLFGGDKGISGVLSIGRVQTPTLGLIVDRDRQIENFKPVNHAVLQADIAHKVGHFSAVFLLNKEMDGVDPEGRLTDMNVAEAIAASARGKPGIITNVERKEGRTQPPKPYSLSSLQMEACSKFSVSAQDVLDGAQALYEAKLTTYPRTDCDYLPEEQFTDAPGILKRLGAIPEFKEMTEGADPKLKSSAWNTAKITAHHAIIPTGEMPGNLTELQNNLYSLIARNYILQFWPAEIYETQKITLVVDGKTTWEATGRVVKSPGFKRFMKSEADRPLPRVEKNDSCNCDSVEILKKQTTPPAHFTDSTIIEAMKSVHKYVTDPQAKAKLKETSGIGTEATRASILEVLKKRNYIQVVKKKSLVSTDIGRAVVDLAPPSIRDVANTAFLEDVLGDIAEGKEQVDKAVKLYSRKLSPMIDEIFGQSGAVMSSGAKTFPCPRCGKPLRRVKSQKTKSLFWICTGFNRDDPHRDDPQSCKFIAPDVKGKPGEARPAAEVSNIPCPKCGKPLARREGKYGPWWGCTGYSDGCDYRAGDNNGQPGEEKAKAPEAAGKFKCPECGKPLRYLRRKDGSGTFFMCDNEKKHKNKKARIFDDNKGSPVFPT